jgi:hypothetical protein
MGKKNGKRIWLHQNEMWEYLKAPEENIDSNKTIPRTG